MSLTSKATVMGAVLALGIAGAAHAQKPPRKPQDTRRAVPSESVSRQQINEGTVGLAGGLLEGAPIRLATEISRVVNDGANLHVLPIVTRGPTENVNDLLYLKGVDMAIIASDSPRNTNPRCQTSSGGSRISSTCSHPRCIYRPPRDQVAARSRRQEGQLQYPGYGGGLYRPASLQPPGSRSKQDLHRAPRGDGANEKPQ